MSLIHFQPILSSLSWHLEHICACFSHSCPLYSFSCGLNFSDDFIFLFNIIFINYASLYLCFVLCYLFFFWAVASLFWAIVLYRNYFIIIIMTENLIRNTICSMKIDFSGKCLYLSVFTLLPPSWSMCKSYLDTWEYSSLIEVSFSWISYLPEVWEQGD